MSPQFDLVIAGGGLAGVLAALAVARERPELKLLLIEAEERFGGNHVWSFFDTDVRAEHRWLVDLMVARHWPEHDVRFPARRRTLGIGYNSIRSSGLDRVVRGELQPGQYRLGLSIVEVAPTHVTLADGERITASSVIDARGPEASTGLDLGWQKFVGRTMAFERPHGCERPLIMDATVEQEDGYRFVYLLPFSDTELMVEDTYYSASAVLDTGLISARIDQYVAQNFAAAHRIVSEESGVLPVLLGGEVSSLWSGLPVAKLGLRGGFFHPTTGYSLPDAVRNAMLLARQREISSAALHQLLETRAKTLWKERSFFPLINRMLFRAAAPAERYRVLEHFYRLPEGVVGRFYAAELTALDKVRILSGRPPVPIGPALAAMRSKAA